MDENPSHRHPGSTGNIHRKQPQRNLKNAHLVLQQGAAIRKARAFLVWQSSLETNGSIILKTFAQSMSE